MEKKKNSLEIYEVASKAPVIHETTENDIQVKVRCKSRIYHLLLYSYVKKLWGMHVILGPLIYSEQWFWLIQENTIVIQV